MGGPPLSGPHVHRRAERPASTAAPTRRFRRRGAELHPFSVQYRWRHPAPDVHLRSGPPAARRRRGARIYRSVVPGWRSGFRSGLVKHCSGSAQVAGRSIGRVRAAGLHSGEAGCPDDRLPGAAISRATCRGCGGRPRVRHCARARPADGRLSDAECRASKSPGAIGKARRARPVRRRHRARAE